MQIDWNANKTYRELSEAIRMNTGSGFGYCISNRRCKNGQIFQNNWNKEKNRKKKQKNNKKTKCNKKKKNFFFFFLIFVIKKSKGFFFFSLSLKIDLL